MPKLNQTDLFSGRTWENFFQSLNNPVLIFDTQHTILAANRAALNFSGMFEKDLIGQKCYEILHGYRVPPQHCPVEKWLASGLCEVTEIDMEVFGRSCLSVCSPVCDDTGRLEMVAHSIIDVTERKHAQKALWEREAEYQTVFETFGAAAAIIEEDMTIASVNQEFEKLSGDTKEEVEGKKKWTEYVVGQDLKRMEKYHRERRRKGGKAPEEYEAGLVDSQGNVRRVLVKVKMIPGTGKSIASLLDLTELRQAEEESRRSERELAVRNRIARVFLTHSGEEIYGEVLEIVLQTLESGHGVFGYIDEQGSLVCPSLTRDVWDQCRLPNKDIVFPPETWPSTWQQILTENKIICSNDPFKMPKGHIPVNRALFVPIVHQGKAIGCFIIGNKDSDYSDQDINLLGSIADYISPILAMRLEEDKMKKAQARAVEILQASETKFRELFNNMKDGVAVYEAIQGGENFIIKDFNHGAEQVEKIRREEIIGRSILEVFPGVKEFGLLDVLQRVWKTGRPEFFPTAFYQDERISGWRENYIYKLPSGEVVAVYDDVTDRKQSEERLRKSEAKYRNFIETLPSMVFRVKVFREDVPQKDREEILNLIENIKKAGEDTLEEAVSKAIDRALPFVEAVVIDSNKLASDILGYSLDHLGNLFMADLIAPAHQEIALRNIFKLFAQGYQYDLEYDLVTAEGKIINGSVNVNLAEPEWPFVVQGVVNDITEQKRIQEEKDRLENQLRHVQKMEAIGSLAGGIAHDFNNILTSIIGYTELILEDLPEGEQVRDDLAQILKGGHRAKNLIKQIMAFSREEEQERRPVRIHIIVEEALKLIMAATPSNIEIQENISAKTEEVMADPAEIHRVVMNLCTNAVYAMREKGGVLEITLAKVSLEDPLAARRLGLQPGPYLKLTVWDTGEGISAANLDRIFDPYFTTKQRGEGTGMGLSVVHGVVENCGGAISVQSKPGEGAVFDVFLPVITDEVDIEAETVIQPAKGRERILFVDDEEAIVTVVKRMLEHAGYQVEVRTSSLEGLEVFRARPDKFDLIITDYMMPNMTGFKLAEEIKHIRGDIPVILCTGYSETITEEQAEFIGIRDILMKPVVRGELIQAIRKALNSEKGQELDAGDYG